MRAFILAVTGLALSVAACSSYGTSVVAVTKTRAAVASVSVSIPRSLQAGQTARAVATIKDANGATLADRPLAWFTSSASIASVTDSGVVSAVAPGDAVLSAVSEGVAGQATLAVSAPPPTPTPVATILVAITPASVLVGQRALAIATLEDANGNPLSGRTVTWQSSNTSIASVVSTGDVSAVGAGTATITAASEGQTGLAALTVVVPPPIPVASVSVSPATATLQIGGTVQLAAVTRDANNIVLTGRTIIWSSANTSIATVSAAGLVTAIASGGVQITASSEGQMASSAITVSAPIPPVAVASVSVSPATATLQIGGTTQLAAVTRDASNNVLTGRVITWSSSNMSVATVSPAGLVSAVTAGPAQITATSEGKTGSAAITVSAPAPVPVASVSVTPAAPSLQVGGTVQLSAVTRDANNNVLVGRVVAWSTANTAVASVTSSGLVTAVSAGTTTATATSEGKSGIATVTVTAVPPPPPPPTGIWRSNEPAGMTLISDQPFTTMPSNGWQMQNQAVLVNDTSGPQSPGSVLEMPYPAGFPGGYSSGQAWNALSGPINTLYFAAWVKFSSNWQGNPSLVNKIFFLSISGYNSFFAAGYGAGTDPMQVAIGLQGIVNLGGSSFTQPNVVPGAHFTRGQWDLLEMVIKTNTAGNADGRVDFYLNGTLVTSQPGIQWTSGASNIEIASMSPIWGGSSGVVTNDMDLRFDHVYLSGKR